MIDDPFAQSNDALPPDDSLPPGLEPPPPGAESLGWIDTMIKAITQPNELAYTQIANDPGLSVQRAALWYLLSSVFTIFIALAMSFVFNPTVFQLFQNSSLGSGDTANLVAGVAGLLLCMVPFGAIFYTLTLMLAVAIVQLIARMFGGQGNFSQVFYTYCAFLTPLAPVSALIGSIPFIGCLGIFLSIYMLYLQVLSVKAANRFGWGPAVGAVILPIVIILVLFCCVTFAAIAMLGPAIGNTFNQIQNQLQTTPQY